MESSTIEDRENRMKGTKGKLRSCHFLGAGAHESADAAGDWAISHVQTCKLRHIRQAGGLERMKRNRAAHDIVSCASLKRNMKIKGKGKYK